MPPVVVYDNLWLEVSSDRISGMLHAAECKGPGHPDQLADDLAESLSRKFATHTRELFGAPLHHNFDKLALLGGQSEVWYGGGRMVRPVRALVNGRLTTHFGGEELPWKDWLTETIEGFFAERLPDLSTRTELLIEFNMTTASSPGRVTTNKPGPQGARHFWFAPRDLSDLRERTELLANDTAFGCGFAPLNNVQCFAKGLSQFLGRHADKIPWLGTDTKVMVAGHAQSIDAVVCAPIVASHTTSRKQYRAHVQALSESIRDYGKKSFPEVSFSLLLNNRDRPDEDEIYLTLLGSSLESGDEGLVGRGNRVNGLITPFDPMSIEGLWGKNPVYHAGKIYNVLAHRMARTIHESIGGQVHVNLISATGALLEKPWRIQVRTERDVDVHTIRALVDAQLESIPRVTDEFLRGDALTQ